MATLYFNAAVNDNWNTLGNWWQNVGFTVPAVAIPTTGDTCEMYGQISTSPTSPLVYAAINWRTGQNMANLTNISAAVVISFYGTTYTEGNLNTAVFNNNTFNDGDIATATFNNSSYHQNGTITTATFNAGTYSISTVINGTFNSGSSNQYILTNGTFAGGSNGADGVVTTGVFTGSGGNGAGGIVVSGTFNDTSFNEGEVTTATFNDNAQNNNGGIVGTGTFNDDSVNNIGGTVTTATFNNSSLNEGDCTTATFNNGAFNENGGTVVNATFNDDSQNSSGDITNGIFNDDSINEDNVTNGIFNDNSIHFSGTVDYLSVTVIRTPNTNDWTLRNNFLDTNNGAVITNPIIILGIPTLPIPSFPMLVTTSMSMLFQFDGAVLNRTSGNIFTTLASALAFYNIQEIGVVDETLNLGDVTVPGYLWAHNLDEVNSIEIGSSTSYVMNLKAGEFGLAPMNISSIHAKSTGGPCKLEYLLASQ